MRFARICRNDTPTCGGFHTSAVYLHFLANKPPLRFIVTLCGGH